MNGPIDEKSFDEYLQRGSSVSQQYRALDGDDVPSELDERVLARAADAVRSSSEKARAWRRWSVPVGLAASVVLVASIVLEGIRQEAVVTRAPAPSLADDTVRESATEATPSSAAKPQRPLAAPAEAVPAPPPPDRAAAPARSAPRAQSRPQPSRAIADQERVVESPRSQQAKKTSSADAAAVQREEASEQALQASAQREVESGREASMSADSMSADSERRLRAAVPPSALGGRTSAAYEARAIELEPIDTNADQWLKRIRELRETGKTDEADREWQAFLKTYPDYPVDDDDRARP